MNIMDRNYPLFTEVTELLETINRSDSLLTFFSQKVSAVLPHPLIENGWTFHGMLPAETTDISITLELKRYAPYIHIHRADEGESFKACELTLLGESQYLMECLLDSFDNARDALARESLDAGLTSTRPKREAAAEVYPGIGGIRMENEIYSRRQPCRLRS